MPFMNAGRIIDYRLFWRTKLLSLKLDLIKYINDISFFLFSYKKMARQDPLCRKVFGITSTSFFDYVIAHQNLVGNGAFVYIRMTIK